MITVKPNLPTQTDACSPAAVWSLTAVWSPTNGNLKALMLWLCRWSETRRRLKGVMLSVIPLAGGQTAVNIFLLARAKYEILIK